ncbi:MAG: HtaA domain-containing protein [Solirubrobacterales bacterium]|nr:HtaA domain-containing protein [Solirubrobacterales bacterium]
MPVLALACALIAIAMASAPRPADAAVVDISEGEVAWGFKQSWRNYAGPGTVTEGAGVNEDGTYRFPVASGTFDDETDTTVLELSGRVQWQSYPNFYGDGKYGLDTTLTDLRVIISPEEQVIRGTHIGYLQDDPNHQLHEFENQVMARLDIAGATTSFEDGRASWSDVPAVLGAGIAFYPEGTAADPVSIEYEGPGGVPDLGEHFGRPGEVVVDPSGRWVSPNANQTISRQGRKIFVSAGGEIVHVAEMNGGTTASAAMTVTALDAQTMEPVGSPLVVDYPYNQGTYFKLGFDPGTDTIFYVTGRDGAGGNETTVRSARWDPGSESYEPGVVGRLDDATGNIVGSVTWNQVKGELAVIARPASSSNIFHKADLVRFTTDGTGWQKHASPLLLPSEGPYADTSNTTSPWGEASPVSDFQPLAVARDGSYIHAPGSSSASLAAGGKYAYPALRIEVDGSGDATVSPIPGTLIGDPASSTHWFSSARSGADGSVILHYTGTDSPAYLRVDVGEDGELVVGEGVSAPQGPLEANLFGASIAGDPERGWEWVTDHADPEGYTINVLEDDEILSRIAYPDFIRQAGGYPMIATGTDGSLYFPVDDAATGRRGYQRLAVAGVLPRFVGQPESADVELGVGEDSENVSFTSTVAGGDPAPTRQWQVRRVGESAFTDLEGEDDETLTVAAGPGLDGNEYRAVYTSPAGRIASDFAHLGVSFAPRVTLDPTDRSVLEGEDATFLVATEANPEAEITWQRRLGDQGWQDIGGGEPGYAPNGRALVVEDATAAQSGERFRVRVENSIGTAYSAEASLEVVPELTEPVTFGSGTMDWGFAERWRCYVVGSIARGAIEVSGGVTRVPGTLAEGTLCATGNAGSEALRFPVRGGSYDPATKRLEVKLDGKVRFWGHAHHVPGNTTPQLDTTFSNLRLVAEGESGALYADMVGLERDTGKTVSRAGLALVDLDLSGISPEPTADGLSWNAIPSALSATGKVAFEDYPVGETFDPVSMNLVYGTPKTDPPTEPAARRPVLSVVKRARVRGRTVRVGQVRCLKGNGKACLVKASRLVPLRIAGKRHVGRVLAPRRVAAGKRAVLRLRIPRAAVRSLKGRRASVKFRIVARQPGAPALIRTARVVLLGRG